MAASRAKEIGIVQELFPYAELPNAVRNLAQGLAENSPSVLASTKKVLDHLTRLTLTTDAVVEVNQLRVENRQSHDLKEGLRAALAKRKPEFP
jgi:enoyl-CoA hydratase